MTDFHYSDFYWPITWRDRSVFIRGEAEQAYTNNQLAEVRGPCCMCQEELGIQAEIVLIPKSFHMVTPWGDPGLFGWGCDTCLIPSIGILAVMCENCTDLPTSEITMYIFGPLESGWRVLVEQAQNFTRPIFHSPDFHRGILDIRSSQKNCCETGRNS